MAHTEELYAKAMNNSTATFQKEVQVLKTQIKSITDTHTEQLTQLRKIHEEKLKLADEQLNHAKQAIPKQQTSPLIWLFVIAALILGLVL